jgi:hypothetical protein
MLEEHCTVVPEHNPDMYTFTVPWRGETIFQPDPEFMYRVLGIAPSNVSDDTFVPVGRFEAAVKRGREWKPDKSTPEEKTTARIGVDVSRYGKDYGTVYLRHDGAVVRAYQMYQQDTFLYYMRIKELALELQKEGVTSLHVRVDGGGGFGGGVIDQLKRDRDLQKAFSEYKIFEVHFNGKAYEAKAYSDLATEMYAHAAEALAGVAVLNPPNELEADLCERLYDWRNKLGVSVKMLEPKEDFRSRRDRSPDDGDGFALAVSPDFVFTRRRTTGIPTPHLPKGQSTWGGPARDLPAGAENMAPDPSRPGLPIPQKIDLGELRQKSKWR